ncbi:MAG: leucine-rich repeat domain-containing protein [Ancrocorticia sp.]
MLRGVAGLLAFGLLFPGGAAAAALEVAGDDVVVTETVDTAPGVGGADSATPNVAPEAENAANADSDVVAFSDGALKACVAKELGRVEGTDITVTDMKSLSRLSCPSYGKLDVAPLEYATNLTHLDLAGRELVNATAVSGLTELEHLELGCFYDLGMTCGSNRDLSPFAGLTSLTYLNLTGNGIEDVSPLAGLTNLTSLHLGHEMAFWEDFNYIEDVSPLAGLTNLTTLELGKNKIADVSPLAGLANLTKLDLLGNKVVDVSPLSALGRLSTLDARENQIVDVSPLAGLTSLTGLSLSKNHIVDISSLAGLTNLTYLFLENNEIVDVSALSELTQLASLDLFNNRVVDVSPLAGLTNLTSLILYGNSIVDASPLASLANLEWVSLRDQEVILPYATSGVAFTLPPVRSVDNLDVWVFVDSGAGTSDDGVVTWNHPAGGEGKLGWSKDFKIGAMVLWAEFNGTMTQKVLPAAPVVEQPVASATPTISGKAKVGETLTAKPGKWTEGAAFTYQWLADGMAIKGATKATLVVKADQVGERISVKVTGSKAGYKPVSKTSAKTGAVAKGTLAAATPTISGKAKVGEKLTATPGKWTSGTKFAYQWFASGKKIKGATASTFVVTTDQLGERITVKVTGSKAGYVTESTTSAKTAVVAKGTLTAATPTISGKARVGEKLRATPGTWTSGTKFTYQWLADGKAIKNATKSSYTVKAADAGKQINVKVTGTKSGYKTLAKTSKATGKVTPRS